MSSTAGLKYAKTHEWARIEGEIATIGITSHAADELGDVVLAMLPEVGRTFSAGEALGEIESLKAVSDLYSPLSGVVEAVNETVAAEPQLVNDDPFGKGWLIKLRLSDAAELDALMDQAAYETTIHES